MSSKPTTEALRAFFLADFPQDRAILEESGDGTARMRQKVDVSVHRPGGTVAGPEGEADPVCHVTATYSIPPTGNAS